MGPGSRQERVHFGSRQEGVMVLGLGGHSVLSCHCWNWGKEERECLPGRRDPFQLRLSGNTELGSPIAKP